MPKADELYPFVAPTDNTITIIRDGMTENVSRDLIDKTTPLPNQPQSLAEDA